MAKGGRIGGVLNLKPCVSGTPLTIQNTKSGRVGEAVYVPRKILVRLNDYVKTKDIGYLGKVYDSEAIGWIETLYG